jgi:hypothetical protein
MLVDLGASEEDAMNSPKTMLAVAAHVAAMSSVGVALADDGGNDFSDPGFQQERSESVWVDPGKASRIGIGIDVGGGITGFVDSKVRNTTSVVGGTWSARASFGTRIPVGLELGYVGSATTITGQLSGVRATLHGTTLESTLRYNVFPRARLMPYVFAGLGYQRYSINDKTFQLSDTGIATHDQLLVVPSGVGAVYRFGSIVADARATFRWANGGNLVLETPQQSLETATGTFAPMHTWDASVNVGYEF